MILVIEPDQPSTTPDGSTGTSVRAPEKIPQHESTSKNAISGWKNRSEQQVAPATEFVTRGGSSEHVPVELLPRNIIYRRSQLEEYVSIAAPTPLTSEFS